MYSKVLSPCTPPKKLSSPDASGLLLNNTEVQNSEHHCILYDTFIGYGDINAMLGSVIGVWRNAVRKFSRIAIHLLKQHAHPL